MNARRSGKPPTTHVGPAEPKARTRRHTAGFLAAGLVVALVLAFGVSRFASSEPDGLSKVAADHGLDAREQPHALDDTTFAGYGTALVHDDGLATGIAGTLGVIVTFCCTAVAVWLAAKARDKARRPEPAATPR